MIKKLKKSVLGFTLIEMIIAIAIMAVMAAVLAPSLISYMEESRTASDLQTGEFLVKSVNNAMSDPAVFDEVYHYAVSNNFITYSDSSGTYASQTNDEEFWAPDGQGWATTITFNPATDGSTEYVLTEAIVNDMTYNNGSIVSPARVLENCDAYITSCFINQMTTDDENVSAQLYTALTKDFDNRIRLTSKTYGQSSFTVFVVFDIINDDLTMSCYGAFNGTNLDPTCKAALGTGTTEVIQTPAGPQGNGTQSGTTDAVFDFSALAGGGINSTTGGGTGAINNIKPAATNAVMDKNKFFAFCQTVQNKDQIQNIKFVAAGSRQETTDVSINGDGSVVAWTEGRDVCVSASNNNSKFFAPIDSSNLCNKDYTGFNNLVNISTIYADMSKTTSVSAMFKGNSNLTSIDLTGQTLESCLDMSYLFSGCVNLKTLRMPDARTNKVTNMSCVFEDCQRLSNFPYVSWNTANVTNIAGMFKGCSRLQSVSTSHINVAKVQDFGHMFEGCSQLKSLDLSMWASQIDNGRVFTAMFKDCVKLQDLNLENWEISGDVTHLGQMFESCKSLPAIDMESLFINGTSRCVDFNRMFYACQKIEELDLSTINTLNSDSMYDMFTGMNRLSMITVGAKFSFRGSGRSSCALPSPSYSYIEGADGLWRDDSGATYDPAYIPNCVAATYHAVGDTLPAVLIPRDTWWKGETPKSSIERIKIVNKYRSSSYTETWTADVEGNGSIVVYVEGRTAYLVNMKNSRTKNAFQLSKDATGTFAGFTSLKEIQGLQLINMINTSIADNFFDDCTSLTTITGYERWNVQNLVSTKHMFADTQIRFLQLGLWDMASINNLSSMFENTQLAELDLSNWDVSAVGSYDSMFKNSEKLTSIIMKAWETDPDANYASMFEGCSNLRTISTSSTFVVGDSNVSMFDGCSRIVGGQGTTYINGSSQYARVDLPDAPGYFTTDDNMGTFSARLFATGSASSSYDELTTEGAIGRPWDYRDSVRLLEINLYAMPKRQEKTISVTVPEGMKVKKNSWTMPNNNILDVQFVPLDRNSTQSGLQQNTGSYVNSEAGTLTFTIDQNTTQVTIELLVDMDTVTWSKAKTSNSLTVEDAITVSLGNGHLIKKLSSVSAANGLSGTDLGLGLSTDLQNTVIYVGEEQRLYRVANISSNESFTVYWPEVEIKITSVGSQSGLNAKVVSATDNWSSKIAQNKSTDYVFHKIYRDVKVSSIGLPIVTYLLEEDKAWQKDENLTMTYEVIATNFNGDKVTYKGSRSVIVKDNSVDLSLLSVKAANATAPHISYYDGMPDNVADHLGVIYVEYAGFADVPNVEFNYEYDAGTPGAPKALVQGARVVIPAEQTVDAQIVLINEMGVLKGPFTKSLQSTSNTNGVFVRAMNVIPEDQTEGDQWYLKSITYTVSKLTGSKASITYYCSHWAEASPYGAGIMVGRIKEQTKHTLTLTQDGTVIKTGTASTGVTYNPSYSAYVSDISMPLGSTIAAGNNFQLDISVSGVDYPYTNSCNVVDPTVWLVLPEDVSIAGVQIFNNKNELIDETPIVTRVKAITKGDGSVAVVYQINMSTPDLISTYIIGNSGTSTKNCPMQFKVLCETDAAMRSTTLVLRDTVWFSNRTGPTSLGGSYNENNVSDKYDVNNNNNKTERLSVLKDTTSSVVIQAAGD